jgi:hypothetical protein
MGQSIYILAAAGIFRREENRSRFVYLFGLFQVRVLHHLEAGHSGTVLGPGVIVAGRVMGERLKG